MTPAEQPSLECSPPVEGSASHPRYAADGNGRGGGVITYYQFTSDATRSRENGTMIEPYDVVATPLSDAIKSEVIVRE
ncbi:hypothetical protein PG993_013089 [Apiospora rasikravindrae]|uniref:Uncharacterized protein n=1 Tax=Apiospora rasikravindrae TaxID=990691 RepID=A0ABR1RWM8_9PEZI